MAGSECVKTEAEPASERYFYVNVLDGGLSPHRDVSRCDRTLPMRDKVWGVKEGCLSVNY